LKQLFTIENNNGTAVQPVLSLRLGNHHLGYSITSPGGEVLYSLAYYRTEHTDAAALEELMALTPVLKENFYSVQVAWDFTGNALLSSADHQPEESGTMLRALYGSHGEEAVITENITDWQMYNVYAVPASLLQKVQLHYPAAQSRHQISLSIKQVIAATEEGNMYVDFRPDDFTVLLVKSSRLLLAQTYTYSTPEDVVYYLLKICAQLGLSQQELQLQVSGLIDSDSALYKELYQYFLNIEFRESGWQGNEYPAHFFTTLNDLARCAS
jgi:Protein of unknown function (DUF3822)